MLNLAGGTCCCVLFVLLGTGPAFSQPAGNRLVVRFLPGVLEPPSGQTTGTVNEFSFATFEVRDALAREGVEYLGRLFPAFRREDRFSANLVGESVILEDLSEFYLVSLRAGTGSDADSRLRAIRGVASADWPRLGWALSSYTPNDSYFPKQWGLHNTGQTVCTPWAGPLPNSDKDINAPEAWSVEKGLNASVRVGIIDTGIRATHEDFAGRGC